ncbi:MAG: hypothetical protein QXF26_00800 [Candidatus Bathyarchaeia archaeon]
MATVWGWGDEFEDVKKNCEKYVSKRWKESTEECGIYITARERREDVSYDINAFTSDPYKAGDLAERLFYIALDEGDTKVYFVVVQLFDFTFSDTMTYRSPLEDIEKELKERELTIANKFIEDHKVKPLAKDRKVVFIPELDLLCELESRHANKIVLEIVHCDYSTIKSLLDSLSRALVEEGLATRILGYKLGRGVDELEVLDVDVHGDEVWVWLA